MLYLHKVMVHKFGLNFTTKHVLAANRTLLTGLPRTSVSQQLALALF